MQEHLKVPRCLLVNQYGRPARPKFLRNKSVISPEAKDFHCIPLLQLFDIVCSLGDGKWSRTRPVEVVRSATALSRDSSRLCSFGPMFCLSLCHYQQFNGRHWHWTHLTCRLSRAYSIAQRSLQLQSRTISEENSSASDIASWWRHHSERTSAFPECLQ